MLRFRRCSFAVGLLALLGACHRSPHPAAPAPLNVLFIAVDDLRPFIHAYGDPLAKTPYLDRLAARGTLFSRAYCQQTICNPSRSSLMTGLRPDTLQVVDLDERFRTHAPDIVTLPQYFKQHGFFTQSIGKVFHHRFEDPRSWTAPEAMESSGDAPPPPIERLDGGATRGGRASWEEADDDDDALKDGQTAKLAVEVLRTVRDRPFFLAVGFSRPHLPLVVPKKYLALYPLDQMPLAKNPHAPEDAPPVALRGLGELALYNDIPPDGVIRDEKARELIRAYYGAVSYIDAQIGRLCDSLDQLGLAERTMIVVWGDHGWHLGEHGLWGKATNFEVAARAPLLFRVPGHSTGQKSDALVEFVDIYPTIAELAGLPPPPGLEGVSLAPLIHGRAGAWKRAAFTQTLRGKIMGRSMRTDRYRYTEWAKPGEQPIAFELYDHAVDPDENVNLAGRPKSAAVLRELAVQLREGWRAALP